MAAVLRAEPDWTRLPPGLSPTLRTFLRRCLEKDPRQRIVDAGAAHFVLGDLATPAFAAATGSVRPHSPRRTIVVAGAALALGAALAMAATAMTRRREPAPIVRFDVTPPPDAPLSVGPTGLNLVISPDGKRIVYHAHRAGVSILDARGLDTGEWVTLPQTQGATYPAFSPDSSQLAFFKTGKLYRLSIGSGAVTALADVPDGTGISWGAGDAIVYTRPGAQGGLFRTAAGGGVPIRIAAPDIKAGEQDFMAPELLPDGDAVVFVVRRASGASSRFSIAARAIASGEQKIIVENGVFPRYVRGGYLLYVQGSVLTGSRFDPASLAVVGPAIPLLNGTITKGATANLGISSDGVLTYIPGSTVTYISRFIWLSRDGKALGPASPDNLEYPRYPRISPDGRRFTATVGPAQEGHVWIYDVAGAARPYKLTFNAHNVFPTWSPDGSRIAFSSTRDGPTRNLFALASDGSVVEPTGLVASDKDKSNFDWSRDNVLLYQAPGDATRADLLTQPAAADGKTSLWLQTPFAEGSPVFSRDGKWVAYVSDLTGGDEVWVRPFPGPGSPVRVSSAGGHDPVWSPNGKELFYQEGSKLMVAAVLSTSPMQLQTPTMLFDGGFVPWEQNAPRTFDVSADGRFLMVEPSPRESQRFNVVLNWVEELKRLIPAD
jgi:Tol biopolymer transport system component